MMRFQKVLNFDCNIATSDLKKRNEEMRTIINDETILNYVKAEIFRGDFERAYFCRHFDGHG
jgi:hypothetical protein